ncbi:MAG: hypothetical protein L6R45_22815 [Anaerolineae bacterium]|nr:hypothetical protein [Anaerolineae bacterium]
MISPAILDTDMLMPLFKGTSKVTERAQQHRDLYGYLNITIITYYEVMKGHQYVGAHDADILIAGIALAGGYTLVTQNVKHFQRITGLKVENWLS